MLHHSETISTQDSLFTFIWQANQHNQPTLDLVGSHDHLQATSAPSPPPSSTLLPLSSSTPLPQSSSAPPPPPSNQDDLDLDGSHDASDHVTSQDLFQGSDVSIMPPILLMFKAYNTRFIITFLQANQLHDNQLPPEAKEDNRTLSHQPLPPSSDEGYQHHQPPNQDSVIDHVGC